MTSPLILITNDDGVRAPGIRALFQGMKKVGRPVLIAPDRDNSAASHSLTMTRPLTVKELDTDIFSVDGTPADCVTIGLGKILPATPAILVSGINPGANLGHDISYSGTVSAAKEGTIRGVPSLALSMAGEAPFLYETAVCFAVKMARAILENGIPRDCLLNINVPNLPLQEISGTRLTHQGSRVYENAIQEISDPWGRTRYWIGGGIPSKDTSSESDSNAILTGHISITPIHLDLTNYDSLELFRKKWLHLDP
ncbi:MAG: 5'/3'-nucleotidase SurE [Desulfobulbaceae bacterium]|uniref:5'-nucleotidase SurE n=1 Tax=Candidatus Desulfobia pelagia TaxID=2841692 RepID=A0A8J6NCE3_9BACT|nr:5'/3'-nucleotidase SurE [Candidatus Desulfobia pelagia]